MNYSGTGDTDSSGGHDGVTNRTTQEDEMMEATAAAMATANGEFEFEALKLADRCDRCSAQAFVQVAVPHREFTSENRKTTTTTKTGLTVLHFCGHHYRANELVITAAGYKVNDSRHLINEDPSLSANV